jgi:hypothetical protein
MREPLTTVAPWREVLARPIVRAVAVLAVIDYAGLALTTVLGLAPTIALGLVPAAVGLWVLVLFFYPILPGFLGAAWGTRGHAAGVFCEQLAIGIMAGLHLVWAAFIASLFLP